MHRDTAVCGAIVAAFILFFGLLMFSLPYLASMPPTPAATWAPSVPTSASAPALEPDGFPVATTRGQSMVNECARASGVNPYGTITAKQVQDTTTCVELIRAGLTNIK